MVARLLYRSTAQVTYIGGERGLPGVATQRALCGLFSFLWVSSAPTLLASALYVAMAFVCKLSSLPQPAGVQSCLLGHLPITRARRRLRVAGAGITFSANLLPGLLRELLVERAEHSVELFEGSGGSWKRTKCGRGWMWGGLRAGQGRAVVCHGSFAVQQQRRCLRACQGACGNVAVTAGVRTTAALLPSELPAWRGEVCRWPGRCPPRHQQLFVCCRSASPAKLGDFEDELSRGGGLADVPLMAAVTVAVTEGAGGCAVRAFLSVRARMCEVPA